MMSNVISMQQKTLKKTALAQAIENLTDVFNAERFAAKHEGQLIFAAQRGQWFEFHQHCWKLDESRHVLLRAIELTKDMLLESSQKMIAAALETDKTKRDILVEESTRLARHAQAAQSRAKLDAMLSIAQAYPQISTSQHALDQNDLLLGVQNGVLELERGIFRDGEPGDLITRQSRADWKGGDEEVSCPLFEVFLREVQPDPDVRHWLQKFAGYCLTGRTDEQIFTVLHGRGANGKSVFVEVLKLVLGSYARTAQFETFCENDKSAIRNDLAALDKARLVIACEGAESARLDEGIVKQLTGQDEVTARFLHREHFTFTPHFKIVLVTNHKPVIAGSDDGIWRRVVLVPWNITIPADKRDKRLIEKLSQELPGILAWCVKGYNLWSDQGLSDLPKALELANADYRKDSDIIGMWLSDCCEIDDLSSAKTADIYFSYENWARNGGFRPVSQKTLGDKLREKGFSPSKSGGQRRWCGFYVKSSTY